MSSGVSSAMSTFARGGRSRRKQPRSRAAPGPSAGSVTPLWPSFRVSWWARCSGSWTVATAKMSESGCSYGRCSGAWAPGSSPSTYPRPSARPCGRAAMHRSLNRRVPFGQARQRHGYRGPATPHPTDSLPPGTIHRLGLEQPALTRAGWQHALG